VASEPTTLVSESLGVASDPATLVTNALGAVSEAERSLCAILTASTAPMSFGNLRVLFIIKFGWISNIILRGWILRAVDAVSQPEELLQRQLRESQYNTQNTSLSGTAPNVFETKVAGSEATPSDSETKVVGSEDTPSLGGWPLSGLYGCFLAPDNGKQAKPEL